MARVLLDVFCLGLLVNIIMLAWLHPKCAEGEYAAFAPKAKFGWVCVIGVER